MTHAARSVTTAELARMVGGTLDGPGDVVLHGINTLDAASPDEVTFIAEARYIGAWRRSRAAAAIVSKAVDLAAHTDDAGDAQMGSADAPDRRPLIRVDDAEIASAIVLGHFAPPPPVPDLTPHPTAWVHPQAALGRDVRIGPHVSIDRGASIGDGVVLHAGVRLYADVTIGSGCVIHANTVVRERCRLGANVLVYSNVTIGSDGFGYRPAPDGSGRLLKMPHLGVVEIEADVELGAGCTIDRAKFGVTRIGAGTKIDNLCHIAHNCRIGRGCAIAAHTAFAGSVSVGDGVQIGGGSAVADHRMIGDGAKVGGMTGVVSDVPAGESHLGLPNAPARSTLRQWAAARKLPGLIARFSSGPDTEGS